MLQQTLQLTVQQLLQQCPRDVRLTFYVPCGIDKSRPRVSDVRFYCCCVLLQTRNHVDKHLHMNQRKAKSHSDVLPLRFVKNTVLSSYHTKIKKCL